VSEREPLRLQLEPIASGSLAYVTGCAALQVGPDEVCIVTDHRILPLSWTRDAYYQALLLLGHAEYLDLVAAHLRWLWGRCRRPDELWMRSHLANGEPKDLVYQADQQLYPLLELAEYRRVSGRWPEPPAHDTWSRLVERLWHALPAERGLLPTDENPADDEAALPYSLSTQILYWYTAARLAEVAGDLGTRVDFEAAASAARTAVAEHFVVDGPVGVQWAYETDAGGRHRLYHDANDVPTALAPVWGFCDSSDAHWQATMRFAFSSHNRGYSEGSFGGLGSMHTPGTWPLGDIQEWVAMSMLGERSAARRALRRLVHVASEDGMLPEAYDSETGEWCARHWFAWPGALLGALLREMAGAE
jgi:GH15 family glucan-1,4-alpha-glucosidase